MNMEEKHTPTKKERLESLVRSMNTTAPRAEQLGEEAAAQLGLSGEQAEKLTALRVQKRGRPKGSRTGEARERENRATFIVEKETMRKLRYISLYETKLYKTVIAEAFGRYIEEFEARNGKINLK